MSELVEYLLAQGRGASTAQLYAADVFQFARWYLQTNGQQLQTFTPTDVREYRAYLQTGARLAPGTINRKLAALRAYGNYLIGRGLVETNPAAQARGVRQQRTAPGWLDGAAQGRFTRELERALQAARTPAAQAEARRNLALGLLLLHTGLRVAELCALDLGDLEMGPRSGQLRVRAGKGDKARTVPINLTARRALGALLAAEGRRAGPVFVGRTGARLSPRGVQKMIAELGRRAGVALSPHTLRHTFAKNLINAGVGMEKVAALLGHSSLSTTAVYTLPGERDLVRAVESLED